MLPPYHAHTAHHVIGLMSGTSVDAVDAALVQVRGSGPTLKARLLAFRETPFPPDLRARVLAVCEGGTTAEVCRLNFDLGELFATAALAVAEQAGWRIEDVDLIGSHGQTVSHLPPQGGRAGASLQLGEPSVIAARTGVTTVAEFRYRDLAVGGQGAPLVPYVDWVLFRSDRLTRAVQNIGGIANVTFLPRGATLDDVRAFDTGPGNMVLDGAIAILTGGELTCDVNGRRAAAGRVDADWLAELLAHPFIDQPPPKSTGRETFGPAFAVEAVKEGLRRRLSTEDILATLTAFTAASIARNYALFLEPDGPVEEVILGGGGSYNPTLRRMLAEQWPQLPLKTHEDFGLPGAAKEALAFALLAHETRLGRPTNVPGATGAERAVILGKIIPGGR